MTDDISVSADYSDQHADRRAKAHRAWHAADTIRRLSDRLIGVGPFGLGLDGVLSWVPFPGVAALYSAGAGLILMGHGFKAKASPATLAQMAVYLLVDTSTNTVWGIGSLIDMLFPGHLMAAKALQKDIEVRHGLPDDIAAERAKKKRGLFRKKGG